MPRKRVKSKRAAGLSDADELELVVFASSENLQYQHLK